MMFEFLENSVPITSQQWSEDTVPLVSISCITYNHENFIRDAIEGFLMQKTTFPVEILVHDDASTDKTASIVREYEEQYPHLIKPIYQTENQYSKRDGSIDRIQRGRARGKYVALCEGDDYWTDPLKLQKQVDFLENNPDYGLVHTNFVINNTKTGKKQINNGHFLSDHSLEEYLVGNFHIATLTTCFRKDLLDKIDFSYLEQNFRMGDHPMWIEMMRISRFKYFSETTAIYNMLQNSASRPIDKEKKILFQKNIWEIRLFFAEKYQYNKLVDVIKNNIFYYDSLLLLTQRKFGKSICLFISSKTNKISYIIQYLKFFIYYLFVNN